jgi:hypothetical protein
METWRPVVGFEGRYEVSDAGNIRSLIVVDSRGNRRVPKLLAKCDEVKRGVVIRQRVMLMGLNNSRHQKKVHELVASAFIGERPSGMVVRHLDGNATNNAVSNLAYGTAVDNMRDAIRHGTTVRGELNAKTLVTADVVVALRARAWKRGEQVSVAKELGISPAALNGILKRRTWAWL